MADKLIAVPESLLDDIGKAIGDKRDIATPIPVPDMAMQIGLIGGGGILKQGSFMNESNSTIFSIDISDVVDSAKFFMIKKEDLSDESLIAVRTSIYTLCEIIDGEVDKTICVIRSSAENSPNSLNANCHASTSYYVVKIEDGIINRKNGTASQTGTFIAGEKYNWYVF